MKRKNHRAYLEKNIILIGLCLVTISIWMLPGCGTKEAENGLIEINPTETTSEANKAPVIIVKDNQDNAIESPDDLLDSEEEADEELMKDTDNDISNEYYEYIPEEATCDKDSAFIEPILLNPTSNGVTVEWFTQGSCDLNEVILYADNGLMDNKNGSDMSEADSDTNKQTNNAGEENIIRIIQADNVKLSRMRGGKKESNCNNPNTDADIYRHRAHVDELPVNRGHLSDRIGYRVRSNDTYSEKYSLASVPAEGVPVRILLTSDHQIKPMTAANIQKVYETVGNVDAVFVNGDIVDVIDRSYDWFYADNAFLRVMTGTANDKVASKKYYGAPILQQAPIYTAMGNHDYMGVYDNNKDLAYQFNNPRPQDAAEREWEALGKEDDLSESYQEEKSDYIENHSFNRITYNEMFGLINGDNNEESYYSTKIGDVVLITLDVNRVWRLANIGLAGKYSEIPGMGEKTYGYGEFIFERVDDESEQIEFLKNELSSNEYKNSKYKIAMFHHEAHSLGGNQIPAFTDPVAKEAVSPITGQKMVIYDYPIDKDYIVNVIEPLLEDGGVDLLFEAHSHVWNRFKTKKGMNVLETSNVGNCYGGYYDDEDRSFIPSSFVKGDPYYSIRDEWDANNYALKGDLHGLAPIYPTKHELPDGKPYLSSNSITAFSILDTYKGTVDSYYFDTDNPDEGVILFDSFALSE